jgi:hypothetical protein
MGKKRRINTTPGKFTKKFGTHPIMKTDTPDTPDALPEPIIETAAETKTSTATTATETKTSKSRTTKKKKTTTKKTKQTRQSATAS